MPPPSYPTAQVSAGVDKDRSSVPPLSARTALDAYAANPHLRSSPTFEFLHFAVVGTHDVDEEFDVGMLELDEIEEDDDGECWAIQDGPSGQGAGWMVFDVDLEDANGTIFRTPNPNPNPKPDPEPDPNPNPCPLLTLTRRGLPHAHPAQ